MNTKPLSGCVSVPRRRFLPVLPGIFILILAACGCATPGKLFEKKTPEDEIISSRGIVAPHEKVAGWRELAKNARDPSRRQAVIGRLHEAFSSEEDPQLRGELLRILARIDGGLDATILQRAAEDTDPMVRSELCRIVARHPSPGAPAILGRLAMHDPDRDVRLAAIKALGQYPDPEATQVLAKVLRDRDPAVQYFAVQSLKNATHQDFGFDIDRWESFVMGKRSTTGQESSVATRPRSPIEPTKF